MRQSEWNRIERMTQKHNRNFILLHFQKKKQPRKTDRILQQSVEFGVRFMRIRACFMCGGVLRTNDPVELTVWLGQLLPVFVLSVLGEHSRAFAVIVVDHLLEFADSIQYYRIRTIHSILSKIENQNQPSTRELFIYPCQQTTAENNMYICVCVCCGVILFSHETHTHADRRT